MPPSAPGGPDGGLAGQESARPVRSVWDTLAELERAGQHPGPIDALQGPSPTWRHNGDGG
ncbi:MAG: hypothetical protein ACRDRU_27960 [Pseudonocardiaceae bacterium]